MHRHRCTHHLRILDVIHQSRDGLHELLPQRTALAHAVDHVRRPLLLPAQAAEDVHRSPIAHAKERDRSVPQTLNFWQARSSCATESAARTRARVRPSSQGPGELMREGHALPSDGSGGQSFLLSHSPPPFSFSEECGVLLFNLGVFIKGITSSRGQMVV